MLEFALGKRHLSLAAAATSINFVATNMCFNTRLLSRQKYDCRDKSFLATKLFVTTNICRVKKRKEKRTKEEEKIYFRFVATSIRLSRQK